jgi:hypothetical protein
VGQPGRRRVTGAAGVAALFDGLPLVPRAMLAFDQAVHRADDTPVRTAVVEQLVTLPAKERERLGRIVDRIPCRFDDVHAPIRIRRAHLRCVSCEPGSHRPTAVVDAELAAAFTDAEQQLRAELGRSGTAVTRESARR